MSDRSPACDNNLCVECERFTCRCPCHKDEVWDRDYGWQPRESGMCPADCENCRNEGCVHGCHEDQEFSFVYGWQVRESYDRSSSNGD